MRRVALAVLLACLLAGCGAVRQDDAGTVQAWKVEDPYLPPPDPSAYGKADAPAIAPRPATETTAQDEDAPATGAPTDAEVTADLERAYGGKGGTDLDQAAISGDGLAVIPDTAPRKLVALMHAPTTSRASPTSTAAGTGATRARSGPTRPTTARAQSPTRWPPRAT